MVDTVSCRLAAVLGLGEDERALYDRLNMQREAPCGPLRLDPMQPHGRSDIRLKGGGMFADAALTCLADGRRGAVRLLHQRAGEAGEFGYGAAQQRFAKFDVAKQPLERV